MSCRRASAAVACLKAAAEAASDWGASALVLAHDVPIPAGAVACLRRRRQLPSKVSTMSMRPPQQGQMRTGLPGADASSLPASFLLDAGASMASRVRMVARLSARTPLASSP
jgi:hypothetical protein